MFAALSDLFDTQAAPSEAWHLKLADNNGIQEFKNDVGQWRRILAVGWSSCCHFELHQPCYCHDVHPTEPCFGLDGQGTSTESVLERRFPFPWDSCALAKHFMAQDLSESTASLRRLFLGGSSTAPSGKNLQRWRRRQSREQIEQLNRTIYGKRQVLVGYRNEGTWIMVNLGQASSSSADMVLTLDTVVNPLQADALVYEMLHGRFLE